MAWKRRRAIGTGQLHESQRAGCLGNGDDKDRDASDEKLQPLRVVDAAVPSLFAALFAPETDSPVTPPGVLSHSACIRQANCTLHVHLTRTRLRTTYSKVCRDCACSGTNQRRSSTSTVTKAATNPAIVTCAVILSSFTCECVSTQDNTSRYLASPADPMFSRSGMSAQSVRDSGWRCQNDNKQDGQRVGEHRPFLVGNDTCRTPFPSAFSDSASSFSSPSAEAPRSSSATPIRA